MAVKGKRDRLEEDSPVGGRPADSLFIFKPEYIQKLKERPVEALQEIGIKPTRELLKALEGVDVDALMSLLKAYANLQPSSQTRFTM